MHKTLIFSLISMLSAAKLHAASVEQTLQAQAQADQSARSAQKKIDRLAEEKDEMAEEYRHLLAEIDSLNTYNAQIEKLIDSQHQEQASLEVQLDEIDHTQQNLLPLMLDMLKALDAFVKLDAPFLPEERKQRLAGLNEMMDRADVTSAEKYRRLLEAFQVEIQYGRSIEAYGDTLENNRHVDILRIGRIALMYLSLDGTESGYWDKHAGQWVVDNTYKQAVREGLRIARQQAAPKLLVLPVKTAEAE